MTPERSIQRASPTLPGALTQRMVICHARPRTLHCGRDGHLSGSTSWLAEMSAFLTVEQVDAALDRLVELGAVQRVAAGVQRLPLAPGCTCDSCTHDIDCYCWERAD